jgi:hypothetical protein
MSATRFGLGATAAATVGAAALLAGSAGRDELAAGWATKGFLAMALPGVAFGAWLAREHGRAGSRFVVALLAGIGVRFTFATIAAFGAAMAGGSATTGLLAGLAAGFVPVTLFEMAWFSRSRSAPFAGTEPRG